MLRSFLGIHSTSTVVSAMSRLRSGRTKMLFSLQPSGQRESVTRKKSRHHSAISLLVLSSSMGFMLGTTFLFEVFGVFSFFFLKNML